MPLLGCSVLGSSLKNPQPVCGFPMETVSHVLYQCLSHEQELDPKEQLCYAWLLEFLEANESAFALDVP
jgi:hypothetical protein